MLALTSITARNITINKDDPQKEAWAKQLIIDREIECGQRPNPQYVGMTPAQLHQQELDELLHFCAREGEVDMMIEAVNRGANVGSVDRQVYNQTALHAACESGNGHVDVIEELVKSGADINARSINNSTALHEAAYWAHAGAVRTLLDLGADPFLENTNGHTPLLQAEGNWQAVCRPNVMLRPANPNISIAEDPKRSGWRHRMKLPADRKIVVDMLIEAMGNRSAGRGADPYCGGQHWPDEWDDWDEENEHYNPWSRPREVPGSIPPWHNIIERPIPARKHSKFMPKFKFIKDIDDEIAADWAEVKPHAKATGCYVSSDEYDSSKSSRDPLEGSGDTSDYSEPHKDEGETKIAGQRSGMRGAQSDSDSGNDAGLQHSDESEEDSSSKNVQEVVEKKPKKKVYDDGRPTWKRCSDSDYEL